jgi:hypothetical protein
MHGNLEKQLVARDFWPSCSNCRHVEACNTHPQHPAYPHTWHWGKEAVSFPDGELILRSWVGTAATGQPHTGCKSYHMDPHYLSEPRLITASILNWNTKGDNSNPRWQRWSEKRRGPGTTRISTRACFGVTGSSCNSTARSAPR